MAAGLRRCRRLHDGGAAASVHRVFARWKTTSAQYIAAPPPHPTFEKLMADYRHLRKIFTIQDLILSSPDRSFPLPRLARLSQTVASFHLVPTALGFVRKFPNVFTVAYDHTERESIVRLTSAAHQILGSEAAAANAGKNAAADRLVRILSMSQEKTVPLRAVFRVWRELGLPDDFEDSIIAQRSDLFRQEDNPSEPNTHILKLATSSSFQFESVMEKRRRGNGEDYSFLQKYPPGMKLSKPFRARVNEWQKLPYISPYDAIDHEAELTSTKKKKKKQSRNATVRLEKRAVALAHEFLSLTVEKMVEVEKISHFRKWLGIELNMRDMFIDHPGIFYLSTKGKRHTVFLREAYDKGCLIEPNPIYEARRKLLYLIQMGRRRGPASILSIGATNEGDIEEEDEEEEDGDESFE